MSIVEDLADQVESCADRLSLVDRVLPSLEVPATAFAATEAGLPGRVGRELHRHFTTLLADRSAEAADAATHLTDLAESLRTTGRQYAETDDAAARSLAREH